MSRAGPAPGPAGTGALYVSRRGHDLLADPVLNKGTAFTREEREAFGLTGYLPPNVTGLDEQCERVHRNYLRQPDDLHRHVYLRSLQDRNETLFYALLGRHIEEMLPIVYTPTVAEACRRYSQIYQKPRGLFVTPDNVGSLARMLNGLPHRDIDLVVATDNQRILGIGDQGVGGMGIPIGKTSLYVAAAGIHPARTLPVSLDVGTDNEELLGDPLYLGVRRPRMKGDEYFRFLDAFVEGVERHLPGAVLQWEDLGRAAAFRALERYRHRIRSFNDDIQGTAAMTLGGLLAAGSLTGVPCVDAPLVILGAGEAGLGLAHQLVAHAGRAFARERLYVLDSRGLLIEEETRDPEKRAFAVPRARLQGWRVSGPDRPSLLDVVRNVRPQALVAATGVAGVVTEEVVREMAAHVERPVVFPLSNPTSHSEARPEDLYRWTDGRAVVATGSPFPPARLAGGEPRRAAQANNVLVFPGVGLGTLASGAREVSDGMFTAAAVALSSLPGPAELAAGSVFPGVSRLREVSLAVAVAVAAAAHDEGLAELPRPPDLEAAVRARMWEPRYVPYVLVP